MESFYYYYYISFFLFISRTRTSTKLLSTYRQCTSCSFLLTDTAGSHFHPNTGKHQQCQRKAPLLTSTAATCCKRLHERWQIDYIIHREKERWGRATRKERGGGGQGARVQVWLFILRRTLFALKLSGVTTVKPRLSRARRQGLRWKVRPMRPSSAAFGCCVTRLCQNHIPHVCKIWRFQLGLWSVTCTWNGLPVVFSMYEHAHVFVLVYEYDITIVFGLRRVPQRVHQGW
jgi:hypothetical protein